MNENKSHDPQPTDPGSDGSQEPESAERELVPQQDLGKLLKQGDLAETVSGLVELDPSYMGGAPASILLVNWLNQLCSQVRDLQTENRSLQEQVVSARVQNAELTGELRQLRSERRLRGIAITGGSLLIGGAIGFFSQAQELALIVGLVGVLFLLVGWDLLPISRRRS